MVKAKPKRRKAPDPRVPRPYEKDVISLLPESMGAGEVERLLTQIMRRAAWNQDVLDAVLRALELPFAARKHQLVMTPISPLAPGPRKGKEKTISCIARRHADCAAVWCACDCHKPIDERIRR